VASRGVWCSLIDLDPDLLRKKVLGLLAAARAERLSVVRSRVSPGAYDPRDFGKMGQRSETAARIHPPAKPTSDKFGSPSPTERRPTGARPSGSSSGLSRTSLTRGFRDGGLADQKSRVRQSAWLT
jgi:hypothetical protein